MGESPGGERPEAGVKAVKGSPRDVAESALEDLHRLRAHYIAAVGAVLFSFLGVGLLHIAGAVASFSGKIGDLAALAADAEEEARRGELAPS